MNDWYNDRPKNCKLCLYNVLWSFENIALVTNLNHRWFECHYSMFLHSLSAGCCGIRLAFFFFMYIFFYLFIFYFSPPFPLFLFFHRMPDESISLIRAHSWTWVFALDVDIYNCLERCRLILRHVLCEWMNIGED